MCSSTIVCSIFYGSTIDLSGPGIVRLAATVCRVAVWADEKGDVVVLAGILDGEGDLQLVGQKVRSSQTWEVPTSTQG